MNTEKQKNKKGFTLIELLVVVLIIGILAAIALPQYQLAVDKAEFAKLQSMVRSLRDAYDEYVLLHNVGTKNFDDLSFTMPEDFVSSYTGNMYNCVSNNDMFCCMSASGEGWTGDINCGKKDLSFLSHQPFFTSNNVPIKRTALCVAEKDNARANRLCSSLGVCQHISNEWTPKGINNSYKYYLLN
ncbi:MAG: prepilin-type N-terminal cleavage/methylation domain-containing protein [Elusimicrobiaceae bacterium]|nr:prepilin-type N-terminal cleavage/methylation domain-containing protein [Elusimicrobiaceae bacterium]